MSKLKNMFRNSLEKSQMKQAVTGWGIDLLSTTFGPCKSSLDCLLSQPCKETFEYAARLRVEIGAEVK